MTSTQIVFLLAIVSLFISTTNAVGLGLVCVDQAACDAGLSCNSYKNAAGTDIFICTTTCDPALAEVQCGTGVTCANVNDPAGAPRLACALTALTSVCSVTPCTDPATTCNTFNQLCQAPVTTTTTTTTAATTTTLSSVTVTACQDLIRGGNNDCASLARQGYCTNVLYLTLMKAKCPQACSWCLTSTSTSGCVDSVNSVTGISDCPSKAYLCTNSAYKTLMASQCPATCKIGVCGKK